jgi:hypothetical protein
MMMRFTILAAIALGLAEAGCLVTPDADGHVSAEALQAALGSSTTLPTHAFAQCSTLKSIDIPDSVTSFGNTCFLRANYLHTVTFGVGSLLTTIGDNTFFMAGKVTKIDFPSKLTTIGQGTFTESRKLTQVNFPASLHTIGKDTFGACAVTELSVICGATHLGRGGVNANLGGREYYTAGTSENDAILVPRMTQACTNDELIQPPPPPCGSTCAITGTFPGVKITVSHGIDPVYAVHRCFQGTSGACKCVCDTDMDAPYTSENRHANALIGS